MSVSGDTAMNLRKLERAAEAFRAACGKHFPGGQLVVRRFGQPVLNIYSGLARGWRDESAPLAVDDATLFPVYSCGKPLAATLIALLEQRGLLTLDQPLARTLPEFAQAGKGEITLRDILTHRAGLQLGSLTHDHSLLADHPRLWQTLAEKPAHYPRGTFAYMPGEYGIVIEELVRRLTGQPFAEVFAQELAQPLDLSQLRYGYAGRPPESIARCYWLGKKKCMVAGINVAENFEALNNHATMFAAANPAFSLICNADSIARFYDFLLAGGKTPDGRQLVDEHLIRQYTQKQTGGWNKSVNAYLNLSLGFMLGSRLPSFYDWWNSGSCFGHPGIFSSLAFADHATGLSVAMITNGNVGMGEFFKRCVSINHLLRSACR